MSEKEKPGKKPGPGSDKKKQNPGVKLKPAFHQKLKIVADDIGLDMGDLIEREMEDFVNREAKRVAGNLLADSGG